VSLLAALGVSLYKAPVKKYGNANRNYG